MRVEDARMVEDISFSKVIMAMYLTVEGLRGHICAVDKNTAMGVAFEECKTRGIARTIIYSNDMNPAG